MNSRNKLIIFFAIVAILIFILGIIWVRQGGGRIEASPSQVKVIQENDIKVTFNDYLDSVSPKSTSIYNLQIVNNSSQDFENLRIFGYVGLPLADNIIDQSISDWPDFQSTKDYPDDYYFDYVIDLAGRSKATAKMPVKIKRFTEEQNKVYAQVSIQVLTANDPWWNIFSLGGGYSGPIIATVEDVNDLE